MMSIMDLELDTANALAVGPRPQRQPRRGDCGPLPARDLSTASETVSVPAVVASLPGEPLYLDIETVPDYSRLHLFGLPDVPPVRDELPLEKCGEPAEAVNQSVANVATELRDLWPCDAFLDACIAAEKAGKNRDGVLKEIESFRREKQRNRDAAEERRKLLSTTPEYCRIVAVGWAIGSGEVLSSVDDDGTMGERRMLEFVAESIRRCGQVVGFGVLSFDLPVVLFRCALLGVEFPRFLNRSPHGSDVIDLHAARYAGGWGKPMGLKPLAKCMGIDIPAGDCDGSQVESLLANDPEKLGEYVRSDVHITRELHRKFRGYFCR